MRSVFTRGMVSAVAAVACAAGASSASAGQLWVGTRNPATGLITVRTAGLKPTFADGTPVGAFSIREVKNGLFSSTHYLLVRRTAIGAPGGCQTEATGVERVADKFFLDLDASIHPVLYCANPFTECTSCRVEHNLENDYYCACVNNGTVNGECEGRMNDILKGEFILEWALPVPDPTPDPHGN